MPAAAAERTRVLVRHAGIAIDTIVEGAGPAVVLLPSLARDSEDYDEVAAELVGRGLRVLRPQPRGMGKSSGPLANIDDQAPLTKAQVPALSAGVAEVEGVAFPKLRTGGELVELKVRYPAERVVMLSR